MRIAAARKLSRSAVAEASIPENFVSRREIGFVVAPKPLEVIAVAKNSAVTMERSTMGMTIGTKPLTAVTGFFDPDRHPLDR